MAPIQVPSELWRTALLELEEAKEPKGTRRKRKKKANTTSPIRHFTFNLQGEKFVNCSIQRPSNLFFEFARASNEKVSEEYIVIQMDDDDETENNFGAGKSSGHAKDERGYFRYQNDYLRELILRNGIFGLRDDEDFLQESAQVYNFLGCSNSQIQRHCYVFRLSGSIKTNEDHLARLLPNLQEVEAKKGIPKRVKYAGLLFSGITPVALPNDVIVEEIESIKSSGFDFSDGCGLISLKLAKLVQKELKIDGPCPSVFQIRYCGRVTPLGGQRQSRKVTGGGYVCKGILLVDPRDNETLRIQVRSSMLKIKSSRIACDKLQNILGVCDYSQSSCGRLGQQLVCLLSDTVTRKDFMKIQKEFLDSVEAALKDPFAMSWILAMDRRKASWRSFQELLLKSGKDAREEYQRKDAPKEYIKCAKAVTNSRQLPSSSKVQIPLATSRTLFGAVFPEILSDELNEGECVVLIESGLLNTTEHVIVSRSPSYHPGDVRVLRLVSLPDGHPCLSLRNCILFSTKGSRPEPDTMGGGDLDGDKYLVIWHPILLKYASTLKSIPPARYDCTSSTDTPKQGIDWLHYAAQTDNAMLGEVENTFYRLALQYGVQSDEVERLNSLFSNLVDRNPASIEEFRQLKGLVSSVAMGRECIWGEMATVQGQVIEAQQTAVREGDHAMKSSYHLFRNATMRHATNPTVLRGKIMHDFSHHFLESPRADDIKHTMKLWQKLHKHTVSSLTYDDSTTHEERKPDTIEITLAETRAFEEFEKKAFALYEKDLACIVQNKDRTSCIVFEQEARINAIVKRKQEAIAKVKKKERELNEKKKSLELRANNDLESIRRRWAQRKIELQKDSDDEVTQLKEKIKNWRVPLSKKESELSYVEYLFGNYFNWFLSEDHRKLSLEIESLKSKLEEFKQNLKRSEKLYNVKVSEENKQFEQELNAVKENFREEKKKLDLKLKKAQTRMHGFVTEQDKLLEGLDEIEEAWLREKMEQIQDGILGLKENLQEIENETQKPSQKEADIREKIALRCTEKEEIEVKLERYCYPKVLKKAKSELSEIKEKEENVLLGRGHILRRLKQKRWEWENRIADSSAPLAAIERQKQLKCHLKELERILTLEKNRLFGFPRNGVRNGPYKVYYKRAALRRIMSTSQAVILTAGTGCGKSTQIPQYIADDFPFYQDGLDSVESIPSYTRPIRLCCTQPRRVAAQKVAERVAREYQTKLGELVGYRVGKRGSSSSKAAVVSEKTEIEFVTEGLLLVNMMSSKDFLSRYDVVIVDEMHERNCEQDLCVAMLRDYLRENKTSRPSFKIVIMSATIDPGRFCKFFDNCPVVTCEGIMHSIEEEYRPLVEEYPREDTESAIVARAVDVLFDEIMKRPESKVTGDVLIFLSGAREIEECVQKIQRRAKDTGSDVQAFPLYAKLSQDAIDAAATPETRLSKSSRKVICCTNIAETSLTIEGVKFVIDSGRARKLTYSHVYRCSVLREDYVSRASAAQRKGRAGRTQSGWCYYLYSKEFHEQMLPYDPPKILQESVDNLILFSLRVCGKSIEKMSLLDTPHEEDVYKAKERLIDLGFIEPVEPGGDAVLTDDGQLASVLSSIKPESVRMILTACKKYPQCAGSALRLGILMSLDDSIVDKRCQVDQEDKVSHAYGDHLSELKLFEWFEEMHSVASKTNGKHLESLKVKCRDRGLNFNQLKGLQEDIERCHVEFKRRGLLPVSTVSDTSESLGLVGNVSSSKDEYLLRLLISGYFHHIVQCNDPEFLRERGCNLLKDTCLKTFLDRDSYLNYVLPQKQDIFAVDELDGSIQSDKDGCGHGYDEVPISEAPIVSDEVYPSFLLYGRLFYFKGSGGHEKVFMQDASALEGQWIVDETPQRWRDNVHFDPEGFCLCRITIRNVGPRILKQIQDCRIEDKSFLDWVKQASAVDDVFTRSERALIRIIGSQDAVEKAKNSIQSKISSLAKEMHRDDKFCDWKMGLCLSTGMSINGRLKKPSLPKYLQANPKAPTDYGRTIDVILPTEMNSSAAFLNALCLASQRNSSFWQEFCSLLLAKGNKSNSIRFVRSKNAFEFCGLDRQNLADSFRKKSRFILSSVSQHCLLINCNLLPYQARRLATLLEELRKRFPLLLFYLRIKFGNQDEMELMPANFQSEYSWLLVVSKSKKTVEEVRLSFVTMNKAKPKLKKSIKNAIKGNINEEAIFTDTEQISGNTRQQGFENKKCISCRRIVTVFFGRQKQDKKSNNTDDMIIGWNLTICGCTYCRECFRQGVSHCLVNGTFRNVRCLNCKQVVLAKDCRNIFSGLPENQKHLWKHEWSQLCKLIEAKYCEDNLTFLTRHMGRNEDSKRMPGWLACPDCQTAMIFSGSYDFFDCRNEGCRSSCCTRCRQVVTSEEDFRRCRANRCDPW